MKNAGPWKFRATVISGDLQHGHVAYSSSFLHLVAHGTQISIRELHDAPQVGAVLVTPARLHAPQFIMQLANGSDSQATVAQHVQVLAP